MRNILERSVNEALTEQGFVKSGTRAWEHDFGKTRLLADLQRSQWGPQFYISLGIFYLNLEEPPKKLRPHQSHAGGRIQAFFPGARTKALDEALDLERTIVSDEARAKILSEWIHRAVERLKELSSVSKLKSHPLRKKMQDKGVFLPILHRSKDSG